MLIFKCKMCGGALEIDKNMSTAVCEYCGTKQTLPRLDGDKKANMYDRASHFRRNNDYDKAMSIYEDILMEDKSDAEAYWSIVLCKYGIEYVEDPVSHKRVPTINRAQYTSVFIDEDYKLAIEYADSVQREIYETEARAIDEIQKGILEISNNESPFDVFICYKETDESGRRSRDSVLAADIYQELTKEGFKVFFSRITLEDKLGTAYEPYIFAALNSARVMVVVGTKPEFFNAVWVRNEWSRYLALIKSGAEKTLIPAYYGIDPYDLPDEFSNLQAQDMSKLGFMQDLVRGIKKIMGITESKNSNETVAVNNTSVNTMSLLKRAFMFLEDGDWESADEYCEKVLDIEPENAQAYLGKLMVDLKVGNSSLLKDCESPFDDRKNYKKAYKFGDFKLKSELDSYTNFINRRNKNKQLEDIYNNAFYIMSNAKDIETYIEAAEIFESIESYENSKLLAKQCREKGEDVYNQVQYNKAVKLFNSDTDIGLVSEARGIFKKLGGYKDSQLFVDRFDERCEEIHKNILYIQTKAKIDNFSSDYYDKKIKFYTDAAEAFKSISGWKDADEQAENCLKKADYLKAELEKAKTKNKKKKKIFMAIVSIAGIFAALFFALNKIVIPRIEYKKAVEEHKKFLGNNIISQNISAGDTHTAGLKSDGTVVTAGDNNSDKCNVKDWTDILEVSTGRYHTAGLKSDGTVVAVGNNYDGQCNVEKWTDIVVISAGSYHTAGLKSDRRVVAVGNNHYGQCDVKDWTDIVSISAGGYHTAGLKSDGAVVAVGNNDDGQCDVKKWTNIVGISAGGYHTAGLKSDGTVVAVGNNRYGQCDVKDWTDIVEISTGNYYTIGLKSDGTVVAVGNNDDGQCNVKKWTNIVGISAGRSHTIGLKSDGTMVATGDNSDKQCNIKKWKLT